MAKNESLPNTYVESVENGIAHIKCYGGSWLKTAVEEVLNYLKENPDCKAAILNRSDSSGITQYVIPQGSTVIDFQAFLNEKNAVYEEIYEIAAEKAAKDPEVNKAREGIGVIEKERAVVLDEIAKLHEKLKELRAKDDELVGKKDELEGVEVGVQRAMVSEAMHRWGSEKASEILARIGVYNEKASEPQM